MKMFHVKHLIGGLMLAAIVAGCTSGPVVDEMPAITALRADQAIYAMTDCDQLYLAYGGYHRQYSLAYWGEVRDVMKAAQFKVWSDLALTRLQALHCRGY